jgi:hypothetical protein
VQWQRWIFRGREDVGRVMLNWMDWQWQDAVRVFVGGDSGEVMVVVGWSVNYAVRVVGGC